MQYCACVAIFLYTFTVRIFLQSSVEQNTFINIYITLNCVFIYCIIDIAMWCFIL